jgi:hypothetical protein
MDPEIRREIEAAIAEAVARFGMAGEALIEGDQIRLVGAGPEVSTELGSLADTWAELAPPLRARRATEIARRLATARRAKVDVRTSARRGMPSFVAPALVLALAAGGLWFAWQKLGPGAHPAAIATGPVGPRNADEWEKDRADRAERVCEATRSRVMRGATVGPSDVEGWVVELALVSRSGDPASDPTLAEFVRKSPDAGGSKFVWPGAREISGKDGIGTSVEVQSEPFSENGGALHGLRLTFRGKYVVAYFDGGDRRAYLKLANALSHELHADFGALYARCAMATTHHLGAWFLGPDPGAAVASLIYWIGAFSDPPQVRESVLFPDGGRDVRVSGAFDRIAQGTHGFDRLKVRNLLSEHGGMIAGAADAPATVTFPFADANRAARASFELGRVAGVGVSR